MLTSMSKYEGNFLCSMKKSLGLVKSVNTNRLLSVANMLSPREQATKYLIRVTSKLLAAGTPRSEVEILLDLQVSLPHIEMEPNGLRDFTAESCYEYERGMKIARLERTDIVLNDTLRELLKSDTFFKLFMGNYNWRGYAGEDCNCGSSKISTLHIT